MHDWSTLKNSELEEKILKIYQIVYSNNEALAQQAFPILEDLKEEQSRRYDIKYDKYLKKLGMEPKEDDYGPISIGE
jgi:hypothetical protein